MTRPTVDSAITKLRRKTRRLYKEHVALCVFFHGVSSKEKPHLKDSLAQIDRASKRELREVHTKLKATNERIIRHYGLRVPVAEIIKITEQGQLPLSRCRQKDFQQELLAPAAGAAFHHDTILAGMLLQER